MDNNFSIRIKELRIKRNYTQKQLADLIGVTDKAISKWENEGGMPEITIIPILAKILGVTTDFLLTGEDNTKPLSIQEMCAKNDDLELYNELKKKNIFAVDDSKNDLYYYVKKYMALKVAMQIYSDNNLMKFIKPKEDNIYKLSNLNELPEVMIKSAHFFEDYKIFDEFQIYNKHINSIKFDEYVTDGFSNKKFNQGLFNYLTSKKEGNYWLIGINHMIEALIKNSFISKLNEILDLAISNNDLVFSEHEKFRKQNHGVTHFTYDRAGNLIYINHKIGQYFEISEKTMKNALSLGLIDEVKKMNEINSKIIGKRLYLVSDFEFYKNNLLRDDKMSNKEKKIKEITFDEIINVKELIAMDDPSLYKKYIELPATMLEKGFDLIDSGNLKELLKIAHKLGYSNTISKISTLDKEEIGQTWYLDNKSKNSTIHTNIRKSQLEAIKNQLKNEKKIITFRQIINHQNKYFFEKAVVYDMSNIDWALENVSPDRFDIIKLLLDNGAFLHKKWNDSEGLPHDDIDKIGTEILKKRINELVEG